MADGRRMSKAERELRRARLLAARRKNPEMTMADLAIRYGMREKDVQVICAEEGLADEWAKGERARVDAMARAS
ncbi:MAG TPA: hypothetical protein VMY76_00755 [Gemmatimonadales bacterium]|nr:hypothetical protein [Gemmatimonadales bacterium]